MNEISLNIDITKPSLQNKISKQTRQNKISGLIQVDPRILNPASDLSHKEIWKELENELNEHYGTNLKL